MKEIEFVLRDSFVDYLNKTHEITMVARLVTLPTKVNELPNIISDELPKVDDNGSVACKVIANLDEQDMYATIGNAKKALYIGVSICNPVDKYNVDLGYKIASARAKKYDPVLVACNSGILTEAVIHAILYQEMTYIKDNPGVIIKGYNEAKKKHQLAEYKKDCFNQLPDYWKNFISRLSNDLGNFKRAMSLVNEAELEDTNDLYNS